MLDLDLIQKRLDKVAGIGDDHTTWWRIGTHDAPALIAELRAAREAKQRFAKVLEYASYPDPDLESLRRIMAGWDEALDKLAGGGS